MNYIAENDNAPEPSYQVTSASFAGRKPSERGLLFYPVSLGNQLHQAGKLHAAMRLISDIPHPDTGYPNVIIHVTDGIYAFNYQIDDPSLSLKQAREKADANGVNWVNDHLTGIIEELGFQPIILRWSHWEKQYGEEYNAALKALETMWKDQENPFYSYVQQDVEAYLHRRNREGGTLDNDEETERVRNLSTEFVLHECAGYVLIGRHIIEDYMKLLGDQRPELAQIINAHGGLMDGAFRLYPGGQLHAIEWLQKNSKNFPDTLKGAGGLKPIRIELSQVETSNRNAMATQRDIKIQEAARKIQPVSTAGGVARGINSEGDAVAFPNGRAARMRAHHPRPNIAKHIP